MMPTPLLATVALALSLAQAPGAGARAVLDTAIARMGGLPALRAIERVQLEVMTEWQRTAFGERHTPAVGSYELATELRDYRAPAWRYTRRFFTPTGTTEVVNVVTDSVAAVRSNGRWRAQNVAYVGERDELFTFAAERLVVLARDASDARLLADTVVAGERHARIVATVGRFRPTLLFRRGDGLLAAAHFRAAQPNDFGLAPWGEMAVEFRYSRWQKVAAAGPVLPTQLDVHRVGVPYKRMTTLSMKVNPAIAADSFAVADSLRAPFLATARRPMHDLPLDSARIVEGRFAVFGTPGTPLGAVKVGGRWVLVEGGTAPLSVERSVAFLRRADSAAAIGGALITATAAAGVGGTPWLVRQSAPTWVASAARPYVEAALAGAGVRNARTVAIGGDRWIRVGNDSLRVEMVDLPDNPGTAVVYVPSLRWVYSWSAAPAHHDYVLAHVRRRGWTVDRIGSTRSFTGTPVTVAQSAVDTFTVASAALGTTVTVEAHLPRGGTAGRRLPVVYAVQRGVWIDRLRMPAWLASDSSGLPPAIVVAVPDAAGLEGFRPDTPAGDAYARFIADELVAAVESRYAVRPGPGGRLLFGFSAGANVLIDVAVRNPGRFGRVAAVSPGWMFRDAKGGIGETFLDGAIANVERGGAPASRFWFVWGDGPSEWERRSRELGARMIAALRARGGAVHDAGTVPGDHGLALARAAMPGALSFLLSGEDGVAAGRQAPR